MLKMRRPCVLLKLKQFYFIYRKDCFSTFDALSRKFSSSEKNASTTYIRLVKNINGHDISAHRVPAAIVELKIQLMKILVLKLFLPSTKTSLTAIS